MSCIQITVNGLPENKKGVKPQLLQIYLHLSAGRVHPAMYFVIRERSVSKAYPMSMVYINGLPNVFHQP